MSWLLALPVALLFGATLYFLGPPIRRWVTRRALREYRQPVPPGWIPEVVEKVPAVRALSAAQREKLLLAARDLISGCDWEGVNGLRLTRDMQLVIAAQACLLTLELPGEAYPGLRAVLVYPSAFRARHAVDPRKWSGGSLPEPPLAELGEAWNNGNVVIAWDAAMLGGKDPADGHNVVIHEFAHLVDFRFNLTTAFSRLFLLGGSAVPSAGSPAWQKVLVESYQRHCAATENRGRTVLDPYGATNESEFFAVATEAFFERPADLRAEYPALYGELAGLYRQDPATGKD